MKKAHLALLILLTATLAAAQKSNWTNVKNLTIGAEIRVSVEGNKNFRGQVQSVTDDALIIVAANTQEALPRAQVRKIATKGDSHRLRNTLIGLGVGAGAGLGTGAGVDSGCRGNCWFGKNIGKETLTPVGAIVGTLIGVAWPTGRWHEVYRSK